MNYSKQNLHSGMMGRVQRQNDKLFEKQMKNYQTPVLGNDCDKRSGCLDELKGNRLQVNGLKEVQFIKNPPVRILTRSERLPKLNKGRY
jgi:hypothetical protein